jgi:hypothetical protein
MFAVPVCSLAKRGGLHWGEAPPLEPVSLVDSEGQSTLLQPLTRDCTSAYHGAHNRRHFMGCPTDGRQGHSRLVTNSDRPRWRKSLVNREDCGRSWRPPSGEFDGMIRWLWRVHWRKRARVLRGRPTLKAGGNRRRSNRRPAETGEGPMGPSRMRLSKPVIAAGRRFRR